MTYNQFAYIYDDLMKNVPYDSWLHFVNEKMGKYGSELNRSIVDLACGTGELSVRLASNGFNVIGIDLSEDMLAVANQKAVAKNLDIKFYQQSMVELTGFDNMDLVVCFCDSLNYLQTEEDVIQTFKKVFECLKHGGIFIFDVHSIYKISQVFMNQSFVSNDDEVSFIWNCFQGEYPNSVEHDLSFFVKTQNHENLYERFDEYHVQRTYPVSQYEKWLKDAGFTILEITGDFEEISLTDNCERVFFTVKKNASSEQEAY